MTMAIAVNAMGNSTPPFFVFPRKRYAPHFVRDGPVGCTGAGNGSGWMQETEFLQFLQHFVKHTKASEDSKVILLLDNHSSHLSIQSIDFCKANGIILLSSPPHCSRKLQPLGRGVFGPFKRLVNNACDNWMRMNAGKTMSIYDIPGIVKLALPSSVTPGNIQAGFRCSGIWPVNRHIFGEQDFAPSFVTDRDVPQPSARDNNSEKQLTASAPNDTLGLDTITDETGI